MRKEIPAELKPILGEYINSPDSATKAQVEGIAFDWLDDHGIDARHRCTELGSLRLVRTLELLGYDCEDIGLLYRPGKS